MQLFKRSSDKADKKLFLMSNDFVIYFFFTVARIYIFKHKQNIQKDKSEHGVL